MCNAKHSYWARKVQLCSLLTKQGRTSVCTSYAGGIISTRSATTIPHRHGNGKAHPLGVSSPPPKDESLRKHTSDKYSEEDTQEHRREATTENASLQKCL